MGTNFYLLDGTHIGKRAFAGAYCHDCDVSLVTGEPGGYNPPTNPHMISPPPFPAPGTPGFIQALTERASLRRCRGCGKGPCEVGGAMSFSFAVAPEWLNGLPADTKMDDEYGTGGLLVGEFRRELLECKYFFTDTVGREFS